MILAETHFGKLLLGSMMILGMVGFLVLGFAIILPAWWQERKKVRRQRYHGKNYIWHSSRGRRVEGWDDWSNK